MYCGHYDLEKLMNNLALGEFDSPYRDMVINALAEFCCVPASFFLEREDSQELIDRASLMLKKRFRKRVLTI